MLNRHEWEHRCKLLANSKSGTDMFDPPTIAVLTDCHMCVGYGKEGILTVNASRAGVVQNSSNA